MNIRIIGLGSVFMSDDGFGPYVVRVLEAFYDMPPSVRLLDAGVPGLDLGPHLDGADVVILVDTLDGTPGDIHSCRLDGLPKALEQRLADKPMDRWTDGPMEVLLIGVVPEWVATGVTLSRPVRSAIAPVVGLIVTELERLGHPPAVRPVPRQPDTWWERVELEAALAV